MSRFWSISFFTLLLLLLPLSNSGPTFVENPIELTETTEPGLERIYGEFIAGEIYEQVYHTNYRGIVQKVTENGSRYLEDGIPNQDGPNAYLREYLLHQLDDLSDGRLEIEIIGNYMNIVAKLPGYLPGEIPAFVVTAHYDSPSSCPGANCDGSGIATILTLAEILSQYEWPLDIYFMLFNGLHPVPPFLFMEGSQEVAQEMNLRGLETLAIYNIDTILFPHPSISSDAQVQMGYEAGGGYTNGQYWADLTRTMSNNYGSDVIIPVPSLNFALWEASDHYAFYTRGFSGALCAFESGWSVDDSYHGVSDVWYNPTFNYNLGKEVTAAIGLSMAYTMSRTYGEPTLLNFTFITREARTERVYIPITTPTQLEISCRWYGGPATFLLFDPNNQIIGSRVYDDASAWEATELFNISVSNQGLYAFTMENTGHQTVGFELDIKHESDIDSNGILDSREFWMDSVYFSTDQDSDGLSAAEELFLNTDDNDIDSDGDLIDDKFEVDNGLDPTDPLDGSGDIDEDGLTNSQEYLIGLNLFSSDSDSDQMPDLWELENGLNPLFDDSLLDADEDGKTNLQEYLEETDPQIMEMEPIPAIWFVAPPVIIAVIVGFLYLGRDYF